MSPRASLDLGSGPVPGSWSLDESDGDRPILLLSPEGGPPQAMGLHEISSISGDDYCLDLIAGGRAVRLARLGADGPNLREWLWRLWPQVRARVLRVDAPGDHLIVDGATGFDGATRSHAARTGGRGRVMLVDHAVLAAVEGEDLVPVFLTDLAEVGVDRDEWVVSGRFWDGARVSFSKLGPRTEEFAAALTEARARLVAEAERVLAARLPAMKPTDRGRLAARWLPGQMVSLSGLEALVAGAVAAVEDGWLAVVPRAAEAEALRLTCAHEDVYLGYTRPGAVVPPDGEAPPGGQETGETLQDPAGQGEQAAETIGEPQSEGSLPSSDRPPSAQDRPSSSAEPDDPHLWLLADRGTDHAPRWILENLSAADFATYRFIGEDGLPGLVGNLLSSPQFSREALYLPVAEMTGARAELAIPARDLEFLRELRARFAGRVIHGDIVRWQADLDA